MKPNLQCAHCGKTFENLRLLNNHYNQLGIDNIEAAGFFDEYKKMMIKQKKEHIERKKKEGDSDLLFNEKDNEKKE